MDLVKSVGGSFQHILVNDLENETFYAKIVIRVGDRTHEIDSRPSDAMAVAVRAEVPILCGRPGNGQGGHLYGRGNGPAQAPPVERRVGSRRRSPRRSCSVCPPLPT